MKEITYAIIGYGGRGRTFAKIALENPQLFIRIVAVAEPNAEKRALAAEECHLTPEQVFESASDMFDKPKLADAVVVSTLDKLHAQQAIPAMNKGYNVLLEKPMAVTLEDCLAIEETQRKNNVVVCVCHSLRYHPFYSQLKKMMDSGILGEIVCIDAMEGVNHIHQSHSFVRGAWGNEEKSTFMLMAKSCHDVDLLSYLVGKKCERTSSFGSLTYFNSKNRPVSAPEKCIDGCPAEETCPYHVLKVYVENKFWRGLFAGMNLSEEALTEYLVNGPYGKCVFGCDNDVVDHQVAGFEFEGGATATFTMTAFHPGGRFIRVHGTQGYIIGDMEARTLIHTDFASGIITTTEVPAMEGGHGGGDYLVMKSLTEAIRKEDPTAVLTTAQESLSTHKIVFAAETARKEKRVVEVNG